MSFIRFSPGVVRLRRVARACKSGELSRTEYRRQRRALIDQELANLQKHPPEHAVHSSAGLPTLNKQVPSRKNRDATVPRSADKTRERRGPRSAQTSGLQTEQLSAGYQTVEPHHGMAHIWQRSMRRAQRVVARISGRKH